jgi:hypothetical protein
VKNIRITNSKPFFDDLHEMACDSKLGLSALVLGALLLCPSVFAHAQGAPAPITMAPTTGAPTVAASTANYLSMPVNTPRLMGVITKTDPADAATIKSEIKSGKLPKTATFSQLPAGMQKRLADDMIKAMKSLEGSSSTIAAVPPPSRNPFSPSYNVKQLEANVPPVSSFVSFVNLAQIKPQVAQSPVFQIDKNGQGQPVDVALGRVSGIIISGGVHAIYEADGQSYILQPGDPLPDGAGRIVTIEPTDIIVRISGDRYVRVGISANDTTQNGNPGANAGQNNVNDITGV